MPKLLSRQEDSVVLMYQNWLDQLFKGNWFGRVITCRESKRDHLQVSRNILPDLKLAIQAHSACCGLGRLDPCNMVFRLSRRSGPKKGYSLLSQVTAWHVAGEGAKPSGKLVTVSELLLSSSSLLFGVCVCVRVSQVGHRERLGVQHEEGPPLEQPEGCTAALVRMASRFSTCTHPCSRRARTHVVKTPTYQEV